MTYRQLQNTLLATALLAFFTGVGPAHAETPCAGDPAVEGTPGDDELEADTGVAVVFAGLAGDDELIGDTGDDKLCGGSGLDIIEGGDGVDEIFGGSGEDDLKGQGGKDQVYGESGNDEIDGGTEEDLQDGGTGFDVCKEDLTDTARLNCEAD